MDKIKALWVKYKEIITYVFFGFVTTVVNYGVFALCGHVFHFDVVISNAIAWILAVIVAFITNKLWVFESKKRDAKTLGREFVEFVVGRLITLALESVLLWIFVDKLGVNDLIMKIITSVIVMAVNYIFSKFIIFKKKKAE
ncbi:MAG: GtrA family protein [Lachnospiraceae bacterium]|nr:GtrA family protein [Lachnospiraceae bacterium]